MFRNIFLVTLLLVPNSYSAVNKPSAEVIQTIETGTISGGLFIYLGQLFASSEKGELLAYENGKMTKIFQANGGLGSILADNQGRFLFASDDGFVYQTDSKGVSLKSFKYNGEKIVANSYGITALPSGGFVLGGFQCAGRPSLEFYDETYQRIRSFIDGNTGRWSTPAITKDAIFIGGNSPDFFIFSHTGQLLKRVNLGVLWTNNPVVLPNGNIAFGSNGDSGKLFILNARGEIVKTITVKDGPVWSVNFFPEVGLIYTTTGSAFIADIDGNTRAKLRIDGYSWEVQPQLFGDLLVIPSIRPATLDFFDFKGTPRGRISFDGFLRSAPVKLPSGLLAVPIEGPHFGAGRIEILKMN